MRLRFRSVAGAAGLLTAVVFAPLAGPAGALAAPPPEAGARPAVTTWRTDGYGPGNTGFNPVESAVTADAVDTLEYRWSVVSPVVRDSCVRQAPPVVADNRVYVSDQGGVAAYHAGTGARVWRMPFSDPRDETTPSLTVLGGRLLVANSTCQSVSDADGDLRALDAATGALLWTAGRDAPMHVLVVDKEVVVVAGADLGASEVTAYRITDGTVLWTREGNLPRPVSAGGRLLLNRYEQPGSDLVDIRTGQVLWSTDATWTPLAAGPAGGPLYVAGPAGELARVNVETGAVVWTVPAAAGQLSTDGPRLYVTRGTHLVVRDAATGAQRWSSETRQPLGKPVVAGGLLYLTLEGERVRVLDPVTGRMLAESLFEGAIDHPVVVNGRVYVTTGRVLDAFTP